MDDEDQVDLTDRQSCYWDGGFVPDETACASQIAPGGARICPGCALGEQMILETGPLTRPDSPYAPEWGEWRLRVLAAREAALTGLLGALADEWHPPPLPPHPPILPPATPAPLDAKE